MGRVNVVLTGAMAGAMAAVLCVLGCNGKGEPSQTPKLSAAPDATEPGAPTQGPVTFTATVKGQSADSPVAQLVIVRKMYSEPIEGGPGPGVELRGNSAVLDVTDGRVRATLPAPGYYYFRVNAVGSWPEWFVGWIEGDASCEFDLAPAGVGEKSEVGVMVQEHSSAGWSAPREEQATLASRADERAVFRLTPRPPAVHNVRVRIRDLGDAGYADPKAARYPNVGRTSGFWTEYDVAAGTPLEISVPLKKGDTAQQPRIECTGVTPSDWERAAAVMNSVSNAVGGGGHGLEEVVRGVFARESSRLSRVRALSASGRSLPVTVAEELLLQIPPDSREWGFLIETLGRVVYRPEDVSPAMEAYLDRVIAEHANAGVVAEAWQTKTFLADSRGEIEVRDSLLDRLEDPSFASTIAARTTLKYFKRSMGLEAGTPMRKFNFPALDGGRVTSESLLGTRYVLGFWATWCGACKPDYPKLHDIYREVASPLGVEFVSVSWDESVDEIHRFRKEWPMPWRHALVGEEKPLLRELELTAIPNYIVVDENGVVEGSFKTPEEVARVLRTASAGDKPDESAE